MRHLAATDMGRKLGGCAPLGRGAGSSHNTMWPGPRPTCMPSFILIRPTVWPQCTNVTDRDRTGQRSDSIGQTVLQTFAQKSAGHSVSYIGWKCVIYWLVAWSSGRALVFGRCAFAVLRWTCSWWVTTYVGKTSAIGQPTRPTQPFIPLGSINE